MEFLRSWIINIVTISIILILFEIIVPTGKIKKIINLVSGFILLIAVINPFLTLKNQDFKLTQQAVSDSVYIDKKEIEASSRVMEKKQMKQISEVYKRKLAERIKEETDKIEGVSAANVRVEINEDYESEKFGEINKVYIELKKGEKKSDSVNINSIITVKKIEIDSSTKNTDKQVNEELDSETGKLSELVKKSLNKTMEIAMENIIISIV